MAELKRPARLGTPDPVTRSWIVLVIGSAGRFALGLPASILLARALGPSEMGAYAALAALVAIAGATAEGGVTDVAVARLSASRSADPAALSDSANSFAWVRLSITAILCCLGWLAASWLGPLVLARPDASVLVSLALLGVAATAVSGTLTALLQAERSFRGYAAVGLANAGATSVLAAVLYALGALTLPNALIVLGAATSLLSAAVAWRLLPPAWRRGPPEIHRLLVEARSLVGAGRWLWLGSLAEMLSLNLDVLLLQHWSTPSVVGEYGLAVMLAARADVLNHSLYTALVPRASTLAEPGGIRRLAWSGLPRTAVVLVGLGLGAALAEPVVVGLFGEAYRAAVPLLRLLLIVTAIDLFSVPLVVLPIAVGKTYWTTVAELARVTTLVLVSLALMPTLGAYGAIAARLLSRVTRAACLALAATR